MKILQAATKARRSQIIHNLKKTQQSEDATDGMGEEIVNCIFSKGLISII